MQLEWEQFVRSSVHCIRELSVMWVSGCMCEWMGAHVSECVHRHTYVSLGIDVCASFNETLNNGGGAVFCCPCQGRQSILMCVLHIPHVNREAIIPYKHAQAHTHICIHTHTMLSAALTLAPNLISLSATCAFVFATAFMSAVCPFCMSAHT